MTLAEIYEEQDFRTANGRLLLGGDEVPFIEASWSFEMERVPRLEVVVANPAPPVASQFIPVRFYAGFNGLERIQFTGLVLDVNPGPTTTTIVCVGSSYWLEVTYQAILVEIDGLKSISTLVTELLTAAGLMNYVVNIPSTWTPGTFVPQTLQFQTYAEAVKKIAEAEIPGARWFELPTGQIRVEARDSIPSFTVARQYFSGQLTGISEAQPSGVTNADARPRLVEVRGQQKTREVKNRVFVRGTVIDQVQADGSTLAVDVEGDASAPSPWVRKADGSQGFNDLIFANEVFDQAGVAALKAVELVTLHNRLLTEIPALIPGDPELVIGTTVEVLDPDYTGLLGRWFLEGYETSLSARRFQSRLNLLGGIQAGGTVNASPFAQFFRTLEREIIGDREYIVGTFNAGASFDVDGSIVSYAWSDNQTPQIVTGSDQVVSIRVDPTAIVAPWEVTLTVTDDQGATDTFVATIDTALKGEHNFVAEVFTAFDVAASGTRNGGQTWNDETLAGVISVDAKPPIGDSAGVACYGTSAGAIYRTTDWADTVTLALTAVGSQIEDIRWRTGSTQVYAIARDGRVYKSTDDGTSWSLLINLAISLGLPDIRLARIMLANGALWVCGGDGTGLPLLVRNLFKDTWARVTIGGTLLSNAQAAADATLYAAGIAQTREAELALILNSAGLTTAVYYTSDWREWTTWAAAGGQPAKNRGIWIDRDLEEDRFALGYNDNACYTADVAAGVMTVSVAAATLDAGDAHNHGLWVGRQIDGMAGTYLVSAEGTTDGTLYKTWNRFLQVAKLRPATGFPAAPAGGNAKMSAIIGRSAEAEPPGDGGPVPPPGPNPPDFNLVDPRIAVVQNVSAADGRVTWRLPATDLDSAANPWENPAVTVTGFVEDTAPQIRCLTDQIWITFARDNSERIDDTATLPAFISYDGGISWATLPDVVDNVYDACRSADGKFWVLRQFETAPAGFGCQVWVSSDDGVSFTLNRTFNTSGATWRAGIRIAAHPTDANFLAVWGLAFGQDNTAGGSSFSGGFVRVSEDGGASWLAEYGGGSSNTPGFGAFGAIDRTCFYILQSYKMVSACIGTGGIGLIKTSDDGGANWTTVFNDLDSNSRLRPAGFHPGGLIVIFGGTTSTDTSQPLISTDGGNNWTKLTGIPTWKTVVGSPVNIAPDGCAYDVLADILYAIRTSNLAANQQCFRLGRVVMLPYLGREDELEWEEITDNYPTYAASGTHTENISFIPRPAP